MAKGNAQRQAAYRARHLQHEDGRGERLNLIVDLSAKCALRRLALCYGVTQRQIVQWLAHTAEHAAVDRAAASPNGMADYYAGQLRMSLERYAVTHRPNTEPHQGDENCGPS